MNAGERTIDKLLTEQITKEVCDLDEWTVEALEKRHARLMELAKQTWAID